MMSTADRIHPVGQTLPVPALANAVRNSHVPLDLVLEIVEIFLLHRGIAAASVPWTVAVVVGRAWQQLGW